MCTRHLIRNLCCVRLLVPDGRSKGFYFMAKRKRYWLYQTYCNIKTRCNNPNFTHYKHYGGRGIKNLFNSFQEFEEHVSQIPRFDKVKEEKLTLDRIDNDGHYKPGNLAWATRTKQSNNQRRIPRGKSGVIGVFYDKSTGVWLAHMSINGKRTKLKTSADKAVAIAARKKAEQEYRSTIKY